GWIENPIVPKPSGGVIRRSLVLVLVQNWLADRLLLFGRKWLAIARKLIAFDGRQHASRLFAAHDGDARVGPHPEEPRLVRAAAHAVVADNDEHAIALCRTIVSTLNAVKHLPAEMIAPEDPRSEERRVGKEGRSGRSVGGDRE